MSAMVQPGPSDIAYESMDYYVMNGISANPVNNYNDSSEESTSNSQAQNQGSTPHSSKKGSKASNVLPFWGNERTMNLNPLLLTNIKNSPYFKVNLYALKTYHEVIDEIWYQVKHMEPWEKGSRRVSGQTGMCGSVRGVGAGGIVSTPFCILYKLYTLRLTRKQVMGLIRHKDSPFIRALGLMYIRYTQPPETLWDWFWPYLEDKEEFDAKAGGGQKMTIGQMVRHLLIKLEWFSTLFPRIPVPIQKDIETKLREYDQDKRSRGGDNFEEGEVVDEDYGEEDGEGYNNYDVVEEGDQGDADDLYHRDRKSKYREEKRSLHRHQSRSRSREEVSRRSQGDSNFKSVGVQNRSRERLSPSRDRSLERFRCRSRSPRGRSDDRSREIVRSRGRSREKSRDRSPERNRDKSRDRSQERFKDQSSERHKRHRSHRSPSDKKRSREHKHKHHKRRH